MIDALSADYVRTARAKGLPEWVVIGKHALRNTLIPIVTVVGLQFGNLFAGAVLVETVFSWPGMGRLVFESILRRDYPTLMAVLFFSAMMVMVANILTDIVYRLIDPRIRTGAAMTILEASPPLAVETANPSPRPSASPGRVALRQFLRSPSGVGGAGLLILLVLGTLIGPVLYPVDPLDLVGGPFTRAWRRCVARHRLSRPRRAGRIDLWRPRDAYGRRGRGTDHDR